ncbi:MAG: twin-arginine translocase subunit TatC [Cellulomonadaceae bacterium]|jgi:sec-independent protein translocase protein TatC|nr:twin-arginine translocase subunit TatC [Cellulomonadaceae bacterium]
MTPSKRWLARLRAIPGRLRPPTPDESGSATLTNHLIELRYRFLVCMGAILVATVVAALFQPYLLRAVLWPIERGITMFNNDRPGDSVEMVTQGITAGFTLYFRVAFVAGFIAACPVWLYHLWRFIVPGLKERERRAAGGFLGAAIPFFLLGVAFGYFIAPRGFATMLSFNPPGVMSINDVGTFLTFQLRLLVVFGLAFLLPVLMVCLNRLGIVKGAQIAQVRAPAVIVLAVFSAAATPSPDALTMLALLIPLVLMFLIAEVLCHVHDRRKSRGDEAAGVDEAEDAVTSGTSGTASVPDDLVTA